MICWPTSEHWYALLLNLSPVSTTSQSGLMRMLPEYPMALRTRRGRNDALYVASPNWEARARWDTCEFTTKHFTYQLETPVRVPELVRRHVFLLNLRPRLEGTRGEE